MSCLREYHNGTMPDLIYLTDIDPPEDYKVNQYFVIYRWVNLKTRTVFVDDWDERGPVDVFLGWIESKAVEWEGAWEDVRALMGFDDEED